MKNLGRWNCAEEKFTALCLPGMLPGFYQSYNNKGFAYCVNTISTGIRPTDSQTRNYICTSMFDYEHHNGVNYILKEHSFCVYFLPSHYLFLPFEFNHLMNRIVNKLSVKKYTQASKKKYVPTKLISPHNGIGLLPLGKTFILYLNV